MIEPLLQSQLEPIATRHRRLRAARLFTLLWAVAAVVALALLAANHFLQLDVRVPFLALVVAAGTAALIARRRAEQWHPDYHAIAGRIEQRHPELHKLLVTAVEQQPDPASGRYNYLQERLILEAVAESNRHTWLDTVPTGRLAGAQFAQVLAFVVFCAALVGLYRAPAGKPMAALGQAIREATGLTVTPGDANVELGSGLVIMAKFGGKAPATATLVYQPLNQPVQRIPLVKNFKDPVFGHSIPSVTREFRYRIEYEGGATADFKVTVFEYPRLERADAEIRYPDYTKLEPKTLRDTRRVSAVEGSTLNVEFILNKPVKEASLVARDKSVVPLAVNDGQAAATLTGFAFAKSQSYEVRLVDADGRTNKVPAQFIVDVKKNRPPELKFTAPRGDQRVTALQELPFLGEAWDDFGLLRFGLAYSAVGKPEVELVFGEGTKADEKRKFEHLMKFESLGVLPDELVSYYLWAEDIGPDGQTRRTTGDIFFAEVKPFEEIFRGDDGSGGGGGGGGGGGAGGEAAELAEMQKDIITATWNLARQQGVNVVAPVKPPSALPVRVNEPPKKSSPAKSDPPKS
jgi:hypothetical protein